MGGKKAVLFDLFGTLIDVFRRSEYNAIVADMARLLNLPVAPFQAGWRQTTPERGSGVFATGADNVAHICRELGAERERRDIEAAAQLRLDYTRTWIVPRPDVLAAIERLRAAGTKVALVSNCAPEVSQVWPDTALAPHFDATVLSCEVGVRKPAPRIYQIACERLGVRPVDCLFVGDGDDREIEGARAVGMTCVRIRSPEEDPDDALRHHDLDWDGLQIGRIGEVPALLDAAADPR